VTTAAVFGETRLDFWLRGYSREGVTVHWGCPPVHPDGTIWFWTSSAWVSANRFVASVSIDLPNRTLITDNCYCQRVSWFDWECTSSY